MAPLMNQLCRVLSTVRAKYRVTRVCVTTIPMAYTHTPGHKSGSSLKDLKCFTNGKKAVWPADLE